MNRIDQTFKRLKREKRKALIGYVTAGFPTKAGFEKLVPMLEKCGLDLLEVGIPFSDPIADGPTIQYASQVALEHGVTMGWALRSVKNLRRRGVRFPLIFMSYANPIHRMGIDRFFKAAAASGVDGVIIPDMIPEEAGAYARAGEAHDVALIYLVAPTTPSERIKQIAQKTRGFLYVVSLTGVTGVKRAVLGQVTRFLKNVHGVCKKPVAVGFGLSTPQQVRDVSRLVDGVIVGSALIREIEKSKKTSFKSAIHFTRSLRRALDRTPHPNPLPLKRGERD